MQYDKSTLINYRFERCNETIVDVNICIENKRYHNAENRMYYAIFYIVSALALKNDFSTSKHLQLMGWFNKNYIKTKILPSKLGVIYKNAYSKRQGGDYDDFIEFSDSEIMDDYKDMIFFIEEVKTIL